MGKNFDIENARRDFNNAICLMSIIPFLAFVYLLVNEVASSQVMAGRVGYMMFILLTLAIMGIVMGKNVIWRIIERLLLVNQKIVQMQQELIEKNRLAAITETVLTLGHEINNPLLAIQGNLELLSCDCKENNASPVLANRVDTMKGQCERIMEATGKLTHLSKPVTASIGGDSRMIDLNKSR